MTLLDRAPLRAADAGKLLGRILARKSVRSVYQPIVDMGSRDVVAYEALARGPIGPLEYPGSLFDAARRSGLLPHLEWACRESAIQGALDAQLGSVLSLFINVEPSITGTVLPEDLVSIIRAARHKLRIVIELTERDLTSRPADLLRLVQWARESWWGVALDDVGAEPESLALLPFVRPDVVKLDMRLIQESMKAADLVTVDVVREHARRTGAAILAEGIETEEHYEIALGLGATLGQGWLFGRPQPLDGPPPPPESPVRLLPNEELDDDATPFTILAAAGSVERMRQSELDAFSRRIELRAMAGGSPVVLSCFGPAGTCTQAMADRYGRMGRSCAFVGIAGTDLPELGGDDVRLSELPGRDPLQREWVVTGVGAGFAHGLAARGLARASIGDDPEVEVVVSDDLDAVTAAARLLMERVVPR